MKYFSVILLFIYSVSSSSQSRIDSLRTVLKEKNSPEKKCELFTELGTEFYYESEFDSALVYFSSALKLVPNSDKEKKGDITLKIARTYNYMEELDECIYYYHLVKRLYTQANVEPEKQAGLYKDLGRVYYEMAQYDTAMTYYMQAKEIYEKNNINSHEHGVMFHYIGSVFKRQNKMDKACEYYQMEIDFGTKYNLPQIVAEGTYLQVLCFNEDTTRLKQDLKALHMFEALGDERMVAMMYHNVSLSFQECGMPDSSIFYLQKSIDFDRKTGSRSSLTLGLSNMANLLIGMKKYADAEKLLLEAEEIGLQSESKKYLQLERVYEEFSRLKYLQRNFEDAYDFLQLKYAYRDSAMDQEHQDAIHEMELAYETEKKEAEIAKLELSNKQEQYEKEMAEAEAARQSFNNKIYLAGGILVLGLLVFALFKWRESKKQQAIISAQKMQVEMQKELIEEKNKDITDSMIYASSIQQAIITSEDTLASMFNDFFVYYKPRDIVSGDFYWAYQAQDGKKLIAVGDCTGHGVPGAMMSMLGTAFLNEIVVEGKERNPGKILDKLREHVKSAMGKKGGRDGMDMAFCCIEGNNLEYAGANLPLYILRKTELIEVKGDKQPVGFQPSPEKPFETSVITLEKDDRIYLFSDGYADQFGGPKGKKYKYKTFKDKLISVASMNLKEQRRLIDSEFETWKGDLEQLDDVCVIGVSL